MQFRYRWQAVSSPPRHELIDRVCQTTVGIVVFNGESQTWEWTRFTTRVLQGAAPAAGSCSQGLAEAKEQLVCGLDDSQLHRHVLDCGSQFA